MASWDSPDPKLHGAIWRRVRKQCFERDLRTNAPCHICGQEIDYTAKHGSPDAWEPDHVIPRSKRPDLIYDMANIKANITELMQVLDAMPAEHNLMLVGNHGIG